MNQKVSGTIFRTVALLFMVAITSSHLYAQGIVNPGGTDGTWQYGPEKIYTLTSRVGINVPDPARRLHVFNNGSDNFIRVTTKGGASLSSGIAGLELERQVNGTNLMWDVINRGSFEIRRNAWTVFQLGLNEAQLGSQGEKSILNIWGRHISESGNSPDNGSIAIKSWAGTGTGSHLMRIDGNQIETDSDMHFNLISNQDVAMVNGGGAVRINTSDDEAKLNVDSDNYHLKMINGSNAWRVGASNDNWVVGNGKLVFSNTQTSGDATMVMTAQGRVGIGMTTPNRTLDVAGTTRTTVLEITGGADLAEPFEVSGESAIEAGTVVAIDPANAGQLKVANQAYDKTVAGIISGAGNIKPGMVMGQDGSIASGEHPVALTGRVYAKVDASYGAIQPGDLLTTSDTPGHAMKVSDANQAHGAIIGKAMTALDEGTGLVLVLVSLQ